MASRSRLSLCFRTTMPASRPRFPPRVVRFGKDLRIVSRFKRSKETRMSSAKRFSLLCTAVLGFAAPLYAADISGDLKATIVLQGLPCDQVAQQNRNADSDYTVSCNDGNRYHVFVNAQGRVAVEKL